MKRLKETLEELEEKTKNDLGNIYIPMRLRHPHQRLGNHALRVMPIHSGEWAVYGANHG